MTQPGKRLLIVDDDADMRLSLKLALEMAGYTAELAADGREALAIQQERPADVLITDIFMPESDGFEVIDAVRRGFPQTRIVVISGGAKLAKREYLLDAALMDVDAILPKPFDVEALLQTLESIQHRPN
ncbi:MAG TPA: response regulator [Burkholderiales bacterium]|jgi:two-component system response regulator YesN|nr:response regulator [Burkholderiales bacterium]